MLPYSSGTYIYCSCRVVAFKLQLVTCLRIYKDTICLVFLQVVMPTVEADVAFGLGKFNLTLDEVRSRVESALDAVGMLEYLRVSYKHMKKILFSL